MVRLTMPAEAARAFAARDHPDRFSLSEEMHIRKLPALGGPASLTQIVSLIGEDEIGQSRAHVERLCAPSGIAVPTTRKYFICALGDLQFVWERHTEVATYTFIRSTEAEPRFDADPFEGLPRDWIEALPGQVIRATRIALVDGEAPSDWTDRLDSWFSPSDLVVCDVAGGRARIWADFRLHGDGFGRLLILDRDLLGYEPSQLVQRLQELGNYRKLALLGLPVAQRLTPRVSDLEKRLAEITAAIAERTSQDDRLLDDLSALAAELARVTADTRYRMSATHAYAQLCADRLDSLEIAKVKGHPTLADFTERRLLPAVRTCESFSQRLEDLSQRTAWTSSLLRTRVDTALARQNRDLLHSMDKRTQVQLRLQQTVEGLSIVAISYYAVGLLGYLLKGIHHRWPVEPEVATALAVPAILLLVAIILRRLRRHTGGDRNV
ncbi:DUF3422 family protein [Sphingosinicella rhizophila]|uniref:DUF3422 domain-containing protein n=1 Tax=Sphingosinicella rhizophila TaxID=3050082 RepID=A0ABU3Q264_9SPHN|nr:DUF3422 domain-containing protein [Sphingosinicella sp. GR2756]MDT9597402.1 DUF3422 domain-containing protein [Sphingosinicella sp. GR2756]